MTASTPALSGRSGNPGLLQRCEGWLKRLARHRTFCCVLVVFIALGVRVTLLRILPIPAPSVHDEFSYLLAGDTFAHGRLANPPHPLSEFFETIHVNLHPAYASKYPPGQGLFLGLGIALLGHPWYGVLLSVGLMCGLVCWAIQGWLAPIYGLLGGLLSVLIFGLNHYWANSYWGGAVAACGGALVLGALPRLARRPGPGPAAAAACGAIVLANSRPYEGLVFLCGAALAFLWLIRGQKGRARRLLRPATALPALAILIAGAGSMAYYNYALTGSPARLPYSIQQRLYATAPVFWLLPPLPPANRIYRDRFTQEAWEWDGDLYTQARANPLRMPKALADLIVTSLKDGAAAPLGTALLFAIALARVRKTTALLILLAVFSAGFCMEKSLLLHYAAPAVPAVILLAMQGLRALRLVSVGTARPGLRFIALVLLASFTMAALDTSNRRPLLAPREPRSAQEVRASVERKLNAEPGQHVVIVRYSPNHPFHEEIVYNGADIDASKIVWAIDRGATENRRLIDYYRGRHIWLLQPDPPGAALAPYPSE
jgi:hypothetical protein